MSDQHEEKTLQCPSCGARLPALSARCPYCQTVFEEGAETEYMEKLSEIHEDLGSLKYAALQELAAETGESRRFLRKVFKITGILVALLLLVVFIWKQKEEKRSNEEYLWARENYPVMEALYEQGDYRALCDFYEQAMAEDHDVWDFSHWLFCSALRTLYTVEELLEEDVLTPLSDKDRTYLLYSELNLISTEKWDQLSSDDRAYIRKEAAPLLADFEKRFPMTEEEKAIFKGPLKEGRYADYKDCENYIKNHGGES